MKLTKIMELRTKFNYLKLHVYIIFFLKSEERQQFPVGNEK